MIVRDDEKVKKTIAENIVRYRRECNLTQAELAEKIHYSDKSVSKWERADGEPIVGAVTEKKQAETLQKLIDQVLASDKG